MDMIELRELGSSRAIFNTDSSYECLEAGGFASLAAEVNVVPPSRLMTLNGQMIASRAKDGRIKFKLSVKLPSETIGALVYNDYEFMRQLGNSTWIRKCNFFSKEMGGAKKSQEKFLRPDTVSLIVDGSGEICIAGQGIWKNFKVDHCHMLGTLLTCNLSQGGDASVNSVHLFPKNTDHIVVCNKTSSGRILRKEEELGLG
ncbi:hypothetical protein SADUNF_Sadunf16G0302700 [Salix dunnii]|uniref:Uncharacterized protein n=1 Tax=Salix dunnii TaxID=1413687 RepID=A0A835MII5_9ROSI|nr:hypothetical protein SADUNF_Sadunf16G0302700 [Salix dunnii]